MNNSKILSRRNCETLSAIVSDSTRFYKYAEQRFSEINDNERQRRNKIRHELAKRNAKLNRYYNIVPYDHNCIKLTDKRFGNTDDYINASFIVAPYDVPRIYIATQGPLETTLYDFWRMAVEQEVSVIVCLTPQSENGIEKCTRYWPLDNQTIELSNEQAILKVSNIKREIKDIEANSMVRSISVEFYDKATERLIKKQRVTQLHFLGWPDHGVPTETEGVINLIRLYRYLSDEHKPAIVHCSAGCGRTGTFCVIDSAEVLLSQTRKIMMDPVFAMTDEFRKQRTTMVQAQSQYAFCYTALSDYIRQLQEEEEEEE